MFYISNICCLCLKASYDLNKNVRYYDDGNVTLHEKLSLLPALVLKDNDYKLCPDCYKIIKNMYDFTTNSVRCLNIFQDYLKQLKSSKNRCMFQLSVKLRDIVEDVDSLQLRNEDQTTSTEDVEDSSDTKVGMYFPNDDVTTSLCCDLQAFEHYERGHHSVKTEIEDGQLEESFEYNIVEAADIEHQHVTDQEIKTEIKDEDLQMECLTNELENRQLETELSCNQFTDQEYKMEFEEDDVRRKCFPDEDEPECLASASKFQGTFTCDNCKRVFTTSKHCQKHIRRCRDRVYNQPSTSATSIPDKKPRLTNDGDKLYHCDKCDNKFKSLSGLNEHLRRHSGVGLHTCTECHKQFTSPSHLARHLLIHTGEKPHKCTQCQAAFNYAGNLKKHMLTHSGARPHICTQCGQSFTHACALTRHMRTHTGERPYQCNQCNMAFTQSCNLTKHMRTHTGERPYKCTQCNKAFTQSISLLSHMRTHTGERPYQCTQCSKAFTTSSYLTTHMRTHTGEKPYQCTVCSQAFGRNDSLKNHVKSHSYETSNKP